MSQTQAKVSKIRVSNKNPGSLSTGANTQVELDGQKIGGITYLKIEIKPAKVVKVTMEMYVSIDDIEIDADMKLTGQKSPVKMVNTISKFESDVVTR